jgi:hypothetical protein
MNKNESLLSHLQLSDPQYLTNPPRVTRWPEHWQQPRASWWCRQKFLPLAIHPLSHQTGFSTATSKLLSFPFAQPSIQTTGNPTCRHIFFPPGSRQRYSVSKHRLPNSFQLITIRPSPLSTASAKFKQYVVDLWRFCAFYFVTSLIFC